MHLLSRCYCYCTLKKSCVIMLGGGQVCTVTLEIQNRMKALMTLIYYKSVVVDIFEMCVHIGYFLSQVLPVFSLQFELAANAKSNQEQNKNSLPL